MKKRIINQDDRFGKLTILGIDHIKEYKRKYFDKKYNKYYDCIAKKKYYLCQCDCGKKKVIIQDSLLNGKTTSCGCIQKEIATKNAKNINYIDGRTKTILYKKYAGIKRRCYNKNDSHFKYYGERGITMCDEWKNDFLSFKKWAENNGYNDNLTIERIDVNGNYEPNNCRWILLNEQNLNKRNTLYFENKIIKDIMKETNLKYNTIWRRIKNKEKNIVDVFDKQLHSNQYSLKK